MTHLRFIPLALALALAAASALIACSTTAPAAPTDNRGANRMAAPDNVARMDAQMKIMRDMHGKMVNAKTPQERRALNIEHTKITQDGMKMIDGMSGTDMGGLDAQHTMMAKRIEMMQAMMEMMMDRMPAAPAT